MSVDVPGRLHAIKMDVLTLTWQLVAIRCRPLSIGRVTWRCHIVVVGVRSGYWRWLNGCRLWWWLVAVMSWRGVVTVDGGSWEERVFAFVCSQCVFPANAADAAQ